ncbi:MAG: methionyl-tRNA formyltransferase [Acidimicrobiia bacterium]
MVYLGTPQDAVPPLRALVEAGHDVAFVVTQPDRRRSRGAGTQPSPVKVAAVELGLDVRTPERAREIVDEVAASGAELGVVVAFGQILPTALLEALPLGFVNLHFSLLPRWRGAAPVERAILAGDTETGVAVMRVDTGLDTGPVLATVRVPIGPTVTAGELREQLVVAGTELVVATLPGIAAAEPVAQTGEPTYAEKLTVAEFRLDPAQPFDVLDRIVRAGNPRPGAWFEVAGKRVKVWRAHIDVDHLVFDEVQPQGKARMDAAAWQAGLRVELPSFGTG